MDADSDGCIDRACGLAAFVHQSEMRWVAKLVLTIKAQIACCMELRGKERIAAKMLKTFMRQMQVFVRLRWIDPDAAELLTAYATNARDAALGEFGGLDCPGSEVAWVSSRP